MERRSSGISSDVGNEYVGSLVDSGFYEPLVIIGKNSKSFMKGFLLMKVQKEQETEEALN
jgi:hypothetical protein